MATSLQIQLATKGVPDQQAAARVETKEGGLVVAMAAKASPMDLGDQEAVVDMAQPAAKVVLGPVMAAKVAPPTTALAIGQATSKWDLVVDLEAMTMRSMITLPEVWAAEEVVSLCLVPTLWISQDR